MTTKRILKNRKYQFCTMVNLEKYKEANKAREDQWPDLIEKMFDKIIQEGKAHEKLRHPKNAK